MLIRVNPTVNVEALRRALKDAGLMLKSLEYDTYSLLPIPLGKDSMCEMPDCEKGHSVRVRDEDGNMRLLCAKHAQELMIKRGM